MFQVGVDQVNGNTPKDFPREGLNESDEITNYSLCPGGIILKRCEVVS